MLLIMPAHNLISQEGWRQTENERRKKKTFTRASIHSVCITKAVATFVKVK